MADQRQMLIDGVEPLPSAWTDEPDRFYMLANGGGTNSAAMLAGIAERGLRLDANVFADTGSEKPETYRFLEELDHWCFRAGLPQIQVVKASTPKQIMDGSLEAQCVRLGELPSKAYGQPACSIKWKVTPQMQHMAGWIAERGIPQDKVTRLIGFDADEHVRVLRGLQRSEPRKHKEAYPLYEWGWTREDCVAAIERVGLPQPGKSACFFCPSSKKQEILALRTAHPDLLARALEMERRAIAGEGQAPAFRGIGLGRSFNWGGWLKEYDGAAAKGAAFLAAQRDLMSDAGIPEPDCACQDGAEATS